jgi:predicted NBD/HSP70 family sugar kinase
VKAQGSNSKLVRVQNRSLILRLIQKHGSVPRKEIAELAGLTQAAITKITADLIERGLVVEAGAGAKPQGLGRRPIGLSINRERYKIVSVYLGRSILQAAVCDLSGSILFKHEEFGDIYAHEGKAFESEVIACIERLITTHGVASEDLLGISIAAPGPINAKRGILLGLPGNGGKVPETPYDWRNVDIAAIVRERFGVPVFADNEANVAALGESWFGAGIGMSNFVLYSVGLGIGSGVVIDGMLYRGDDDVVSEIGHITIDYRGPRCTCGNVGCLELYAGFKRLVDLHKSGNAAGPTGVFTSKDHSTIAREVEHVFARAAAGEEAARRAVSEIGSFLGIGAVSLANIFSPEAIILSGNDIGGSDLGVFVPILQESVRKGAFSVIANKVKVANSALGKDGRIYGGVALVLQDFFDQPDGGYGTG